MGIAKEKNLETASRSKGTGARDGRFEEGEKSTNVSSCLSWASYSSDWFDSSLMPLL